MTKGQLIEALRASPLPDSAFVYVLHHGELGWTISEVVDVLGRGHVEAHPESLNGVAYQAARFGHVVINTIE